jgi:hypothetical protein
MWLGEVVGAAGVELVGVRRIGTGQMSHSYRVLVHRVGGGEDSVVVKLASAGPSSRATGVGMGGYRRGVAFYGGWR